VYAPSYQQGNRLQAEVKKDGNALVINLPGGRYVIKYKMKEDVKNVL